VAGLGYAQALGRAAALAALRDGDPCFRCGRPMYRALARWLDWDHVNPRVFGGGGPMALSHRHCNRSHGAQLGNALRGQRRRARRPLTR
jgi:hypothetical protein